jgi:hypothetical protein
MSEKTVAQKLGLKAGKTLAVRQQPDDITALIGALPSGAKLVAADNKPCALILMFAKDMAALAQELPGCKLQLEPGGRLRLDAEIPVPNEFNLMLSKFNAGLMRRCLIAWRDERQMGVMFLNA